MSYAALMLHFEAAPSEATTLRWKQSRLSAHPLTRRVAERPA